LQVLMTIFIHARWWPLAAALMWLKGVLEAPA
jgi:hypothetical protein